MYPYRNCRICRPATCYGGWLSATAPYISGATCYWYMDGVLVDVGGQYTKTAKLTLGTLPADVYVLEISDGVNRISKRISKVK